MKKMIEYIREMPEQIKEALNSPTVKLDFVPRNIVFSGMGGSAIAGDLISRVILEEGKFFSMVIRDYVIPGFIDEHTLFISTSYSGNTEETLSAYEHAKKNRAKIVCITSGGKLEQEAQKDGFPVVKIPEGYPPRAALGYIFTLTIKLFVNNGILSEDLLDKMNEVSIFLKELQRDLEAENSLARKVADKFYDRIPLIYTQSRYRPVAERWRAQINENAKAFAHSSELSEMNHNEIAGLLHPENLLKQFFAVYLDDGDLHERTQLRYIFTDDLTRDSISGSLTIKAEGKSVLDRLFYLIYVGDYVSVYLAEYYKEDAVKIERISELKRRLAN